MEETTTDYLKIAGISLLAACGIMIIGAALLKKWF